MKIFNFKHSGVRAALLVVCGLLMWFFVHTVFITFSGMRDNLQRADVAVVLGNEVLPDGRPSERLKARLDEAVAVYADGWTDYLIVSGGIGKEGFDEATVMANYLIERNVPRDFIIVDSAGVTTEATAENTAKIMRERGWESVIIVSQYFHISRSRLALEKNGVREVYWATPDYMETRDAYSIAREFVAYYDYLWR